MPYYGVRKLWVMKSRRERERERERESTTILRQKRYGKKSPFSSPNAFSKRKASPPSPWNFSKSNFLLQSRSLFYSDFASKFQCLLGILLVSTHCGVSLLPRFCFQIPNPCWDSSSIHRFETINNGFDGEEMPIWVNKFL